MTELVTAPRSRRPRPKIVTLTDAAAARVREIMDKAERPYIGLRVGVKNGGCAGQEYVLEYAEAAQPLDEVVEDKGVTILVEPRRCFSGRLDHRLRDLAPRLEVRLPQPERDRRLRLRRKRHHRSGECGVGGCADVHTAVRSQLVSRAASVGARIEDRHRFGPPLQPPGTADGPRADGRRGRAALRRRLGAAVPLLQRGHRALRDRGARVVLGNHDVEYLTRVAHLPSQKGVVDDALVDWLRNQPETIEMDPDGKRLLMVHSTPWTYDYVFPGSREIAALREVDADFVLGGHTHALFSAASAARWWSIPAPPVIRRSAAKA